MLPRDRKSTRLNSSHLGISYAVFCLKKKTNCTSTIHLPTRRARARGYSRAPCSAGASSAWRRHRVERWRCRRFCVVVRFFFNDTATTEIYTLSLHDALPICIRKDAATHRRLKIESEQRDGF